ncbi:MAG TPA: hypothetical protein K8V63_06270, partial [Brevibacterium linens]|nr:hypothetical protein [Brevibacterium linens]
AHRIRHRIVLSGLEISGPRFSDEDGPPTQFVGNSDDRQKSDHKQWGGPISVAQGEARTSNSAPAGNRAAP